MDIKDTVDEKLYTTREAREMLGITKVQMQYFLTRGMVPHLKRTRTGRALLSKSQVDWIGILVMLKNCGLSTSELQRYRKLSEHGEETLPQRKAILETKRQQILQELEDLRGRLDFLNRQQEYFDQILDKKAEYPEQLF